MEEITKHWIFKTNVSVGEIFPETNNELAPGSKSVTRKITPRNPKAYFPYSEGVSTKLKVRFNPIVAITVAYWPFAN